MTEVKLSIEVVNRMLNYLSTKPYSEVAEIIAAVVNEVNRSKEPITTSASEVAE